MGKKRYSVEKIVSILREVEVQTGTGQSLREVLRQIGICDGTLLKRNNGIYAIINSETRQIIKGSYGVKEGYFSRLKEH